MVAMGARKPKRLAGAAAFVAIGVTAAVAAAASIVIVYQNNFSSTGRGHQLTGVQSKHCNKRAVKGSLTVDIKSGPVVCGYKLPVEGSGRQPKQDLEADFKLTKQTPPTLRKHTYFGLRMRANGSKKYYEFRVFPKHGKYGIKRVPNGAGFPVGGTSNKIKPVGHWNTVQMRIFGHHLQAWVNGKKLADLNDKSPGDVPGTQLQVIAANGKHSHNTAVVQIDNLRVSVPKP
jgi:hypothetical protein